MRSYVASDVLDGSIVTPHELMAELRETATAANHLDRDNVPAALLTAAKMAEGAPGTISFHRCSVGASANHESGQSNLLYPFLDDDSNPWIIERPSRDGMLFISFFSTVLTGQALRVALRVNGRLFNAPWSNRSAGHDSQLFRIMVPVQSGVQLIEPLYAHSTAHQVLPVPGFTTSFLDRQVIVMEPRR